MTSDYKAAIEEINAHLEWQRIDDATSELIACPFCGSKARISTISVGYEVKCNDCRACTAYKRDLQEAVALWNRRS